MTMGPEIRDPNKMHEEGPVELRFRMIGLMLFDREHAKDVPLLGERFSAWYRF